MLLVGAVMLGCVADLWAASDKRDDEVDVLKVVYRKPLMKRKRAEFTPMLSVGINDTFRQRFTVGGILAYYPHEAWGVGVSVDYAYAHSNTAYLEDVRFNLFAVPASLAAPKLFMHANAYWVPLDGKISIFKRAIVHFDGYLALGAGAVSALDGVYLPSINLAIGQRYVLSNWLALRFELKNQAFVDHRPRQAGHHARLDNRLTLSFGASFFSWPI